MKNFIGIDLGTTNTVLYSVHADSKDFAPELFTIPQLTAAGESEKKSSLPSFVYLPDAKDLPAGALDLPWAGNRDFCVGAFARKASSQTPGKVISSAKSWLCSQNIDRTAKVLPWNRGNEDRQISPLEASARLLEHLRDAWNAEKAVGDESLRLENQNIILTVPASFDAVARELTVKAAEKAGLKVTLLEEPLAAFYCFLAEKQESWRGDLSVGDTVLVVDIGGGTSDFTLVRAIDEGGNLSFERVAVGRHILLGGDNMDLTLAYSVAQKLKAEKNITLDQYQISGLTHACREAKETLLSDADAKPVKLAVLGRGSSVIGGTISTTLSRAEVDAILMDGFLPECEFGVQAQNQPRSGLRSFGLLYESDPAITKHLAGFLAKHCVEGVAFPNAVLFNGGVTKSSGIRDRIVSVLNKWKAASAPQVKVISGSDPDLAVAKGACVYASIREGGKGIRVKAGSSHAYYIGVESTMPAIPGFTVPVQALCAVPFGMEEGTSADIPYDGLGLIVGETTEFRFFGSTIRRDDTPGRLLDNAPGNPDLEEISKMTAELPAGENLPAGSLVPVRLRAGLTETGTVRIDCIGSEGREWKLEFELRASVSE